MNVILLLRVRKAARRTALALALSLPIVTWSPGALSDDHPTAPVPTDAPTARPAPYVYRSKAVTFARPRALMAAPRPSAPVRRAIQIVPRSEPPPGTKTALVVGIDHKGAEDPLEGAVEDAENVRDALLAYGFHRENVVVLLERDATRPRILAALDRLAQRTPTSGLAVFAVASHGGHSSRGYSFRTVEGERVYASEVGARLRAVRSPVWTLLAMCYAGGWTTPGITGTNRVATYASRANQYTYEKGKDGSTLVVEMVKHGMLEGAADGSVEEAFAFARERMEETGSKSDPVMSDGVEGELNLRS